VDAEGGVVHAVYDSGDNDDAPRQVRYRRSTDGGKTFAASRRLDVVDDRGSPSNGDSSESDLDADGDRLGVVWEDDKVLAGGDADPCCQTDHPAENPSDENRDDIFWSSSADAGKSFSAPVNITGSDDVHNRDPDVVIDDRFVAVVYEGDDVVRQAATDGNDILFQASTDGGKTWGGEVNLTSGAGGGQDESALDATGDAIHIVYRDQQAVAGTSITHIGYVRLDRDGTHPTAPLLLPGPQAQDAAILALGDKVHVVACANPDEEDPAGTAEVLYYRGTAAARRTTFAAPVVLARAAGCDKPAIDGHGDGVHIAVRMEDAGLDDEIWYLHSDNGGSGFGAARNVSNNPMASGDPSVSVDPAHGDVHLAWNDQTVFLFALRSGQALPLEEGGNRWFGGEDVIRYTGRAYRTVLDGSDVGLARWHIDALARLSNFEFVLSFTEPGDLPGVGRVEDSDLVLFTAARLGKSTRGTFSPYFDGSDIGLAGPGEGIDAVEVVRNLDPTTGKVTGVDLYLSATGDFTTADGTSGAAEDVFVCRRSSTGADSACTAIRVAFDGSDAGLAGSSLDAFSFDGIGPGIDDEKFSSYYSTAGDFALPGAHGGGSDVLECFHPAAEPAVTDPLAECGRSTMPLLKTFDGKANVVAENITALEFPFPA
ncbi:MAG: sialidase family protein, partial [Acidimicrobiia bacterium]